MPLQATSGAASYDAFGGGVAAVPNYIEDVFSTWLYTGNGSTQTITNGIDLAGKGGLVWIKSRSNATENLLYDTVRGAYNYLISSTTGAQVNNSPTGLSSFDSTGFNVAGTTIGGGVNGSGATYASWTFRKQPKFFDVVTYTGNGANRTIAHNLDSAPGCIIVKRTDSAADWAVYHQGAAGTSYTVLNTTAAEVVSSTVWNNTAATSTNFSVGTNSIVNASGGTYVAYLFAHNAGGFGLTGTESVVSCGFYSGNSSTSGPLINLGWEPQWLMIKRVSGGTGNWQIIDNMRGMPVGSADATLQANLSNAESSVDYVSPTATGFQVTSSSSEVNASSSFYIYIAIRRGPMKVPTTGTSVFAPNATNNPTGTANATSFPVDLQILNYRSGSAFATFLDRLRGVATSSTSFAAPYLTSTSTAAEATGTNLTNSWGNTGFLTPSDVNNFPAIFWNFRRAPSFMDEVCYTGAGGTQNISHNLGVKPELLIVKKRLLTPLGGWNIYSANLTASTRMVLNSDSAAVASTVNYWGDNTNFVEPTASVFTVGSIGTLNGSTFGYVAYLFASCPGVSKVGSYTGTGAAQVINCGFAAGARFVMIKRTDSTGDWYVWDSARGIVAGNDPYLLLNSTAAEVTNTDFIDTASTGFEISSTAPAAINASGGTYIFLAIA